MQEQEIKHSTKIEHFTESECLMGVQVEREVQDEKRTEMTRTEPEIFTQLIQQMFELKQTDAKSYSPLVLAFVGDSVYELILRTVIVGQGNTSVNRLNRRCSFFAKAATQAAMIRMIEGDLTPEEKQVFKRGRNAKSVTVAKNATMIDYRTATGFEALAGYLYLSGQYRRLTELVEKGMKKIYEQKKIEKI